MPVVYLDTSAALKTLVDEPETQALDAFLAETPRVASSELLYAELHRSAARLGVDRATVERQLGNVVLLALTSDQVRRAAHLPAAPQRSLRTLDALHLAAAFELGAVRILTYDAQQAAAAAYAGLAVVSPGR